MIGDARRGRASIEQRRAARHDVAMRQALHGDQGQIVDDRRQLGKLAATRRAVRSLPKLAQPFAQRLAGSDDAIERGVFGFGQPPALAHDRGNLLAEFGLRDISGPLAILVSRLTYQKGIDLLPAALPSFIEAGGGLAILGTGEPSLEGAMLEAAQRWPGRVAVRIGYDEALSHRMFAGADAVLVPSRFEPCGLTQLYGLRYGAIPVVSSTGGLADTVIGATPASLAAGAATGVTFTTIDEIGLSQALRRLVELYADKSVWTAMQKRGMKSDLGWRRAAQSYVSVYEQIQFR